jgi:FkbM family methyltransferase
VTETVPSDMVSVMLNSDARFLIPKVEPYWSAAEVTNGTYEPEIDSVLRRATGRPYAMLDAGANYGFWSILASSAPYGRHPTVAIEPSLTNFERLVANAGANGNRFHTLRRAVLDESGKRVTLYGKIHSGLSLRKDWHPDEIDQFEEVETITLDEIAERFIPNRSYPAFIKLDIEGSEVEGLKGARRLIDEGALVVYEDHGKEATHPVSRFVLSLDDVVVWRIGSDKRAVRITAIEQVAAIKTDPILGYNFFAHRRSSPWWSAFED